MSRWNIHHVAVEVPFRCVQVQISLVRGGVRSLTKLALLFTADLNSSFIQRSATGAPSPSGLHDNHLRRMCREARRAIQKVVNMQNDPFSRTALSGTHGKHVHTAEFVRWSLTCKVTEYRKYKSSWEGGGVLWNIWPHKVIYTNKYRVFLSFFSPYLTQFHSADFPGNFHTITKVTVLICTVK